MFRPFALSAALALCLGSTPAHAQLGPSGLPLPSASLAELADIQLTPAQRGELLLILTRARAAQLQLRADQEAMLARAEQELSGEAPNLMQLAAEQEALTDARLASIRQLRDELLAFYAQLTPAQQAQVHSWLVRQIGRIERAKSAFATLRELLADHH